MTKFIFILVLLVLFRQPAWCFKDVTLVDYMISKRRFIVSTVILVAVLVMCSLMLTIFANYFFEYY